MKEHFCSIEKEWIGYEGQCNWCGEKELVVKRPWVGLTNKELNVLYEEHHDQHGLPKQGNPDGFDYERAIEAKLKELNT